MNNTISGLSPTTVWQYFEKVCSIPRPSKKEGKIIHYLEAFAKNENLEIKIDEVGNVLISKSAFPGMENRNKVIMQSHLDMVCEKNQYSKHNFDTDPIQPFIDGEWVKARDTTLGADCGIGIAAQLAILSSTQIKHGPIECLFTVDEESGLTGAFALKPDFLKGTILLNLDSEDEGILFIGCAGGIDTLVNYTIEWVMAPKGYFAVQLSVSGLLGGHSGDDIDKGRHNALKVLTRFIWNSMQKFDVKVAHIEGGNLRNAIPREARAIIVIPSKEKEALVADFNIYRSLVWDEISTTEPSVKLQLESTDLPERVFSEKTTLSLIRSLYIVPTGVFSMSQRMHDMVETSTNLASIKQTGDSTLSITTSQRSDRETCKEHIANIIKTVFEQAGAKVEHSDGYPGWSPNPDSEILKRAIGIYNKLFGNPPLVRSIHAGLECGLFLEKYPSLDMISFGPTIKGAHSPDERIEIASVQKFWDFLIQIIENIPES
jgi:dipeptidase D